MTSQPNSGDRTAPPGSIDEPIERCSHASCSGARLLPGTSCLGHATQDELDAGLAHCRAGQRLDARATTISAERLSRVLDAFADERHVPRLPAADFRGTLFTGPAEFDDATFCSVALFDSAVFRGSVSFREVTFDGHADFDSATFAAVARFERTTFGDHAGFQQATFAGHGWFAGATFRSYADFEGATFCHRANFSSATFQLAHQLGPMVVHESLMFDHGVFAERVNIEAAAVVVSGRGTRFADGVNLRVRWAEIALDDADFARASTLSGATWPPGSEDLPAVCIADGRGVELEPRPRLITLRGAQVAALSLSDLDLRACRFFGAHGLQTLNVESSCEWARAPGSRRCGLRRYIGRETIAEEHHSRHLPNDPWDDGFTRTPGWLEDRDGRDEPLERAQLAGLYRALRKAREDNKDQAGAGDLYYGEMEMRRHARMRERKQQRGMRCRSDHAVLFAYWLLSGYGLRASRAAIALLALVLLASVGLQAWGFTTDPQYTRALLFGIESTSSLLRVPNAAGLQMTYAGEGAQIVLRLVGPLLIGLALLAVRARVKR